MEERAKKIVCKKCKCRTYEDAVAYMGKTYVETMLSSIIDVMKIQREYDIEKACSVTCELCYSKRFGCTDQDTCEKLQIFCKAMEE